MSDTIGLIVAMKMEGRPLLRLLGPGRRHRISGFPARLFSLPDAECVLVESGMGIQRATAAARALVKAFMPRALISFGIAGAVEKELRIGDVIVAVQVAAFGKDGTSPALNLDPISVPAREAVQRVLETRGARLYTGTAMTTPGAQPTRVQLQAWAHPVLEMETMGIARVARENGTPLLSIRSISDNPDEPIPFALEDFIDAHDNFKSASMAIEILRHPAILGRLIRFGRNGKRAAENAAAAVAAILERS
jgi:adenosylhomocysteine nucleosidase